LPETTSIGCSGSLWAYAQAAARTPRSAPDMPKNVCCKIPDSERRHYPSTPLGRSGRTIVVDKWHFEYHPAIVFALRAVVNTPNDGDDWHDLPELHRLSQLQREQWQDLCIRRFLGVNLSAANQAGVSLNQRPDQDLARKSPSERPPEYHEGPVTGGQSTNPADSLTAGLPWLRYGAGKYPHWHCD